MTHIKQTLCLKELDLHVTNRCTLRCPVCCFDSGEKILQELSLETITTMLKNACALGCRELHITGGEPLLRNDLEEIVCCAIENNMEVRLQTNGTLLSRERMLSLSTAGLKRIMISLDSANKDINDKLRGLGAYDAAINAIDIANDFGLQVRVNSVLSKISLPMFPEVVRLCSKLGVMQVSGFYFSPIGRGRKFAEMWIPPDRYMKQYADIEKQVVGMRGQEIPEEMDIVIEPAYASWKEAISIIPDGFSGCGGGCHHAMNTRDYLIVRSDGNVYPCILAIEWEQGLGNITDRSIAEIWRDDVAWRILDRSSAFEWCEGCKHIILCNGGCAGYAHAFSANTSAPDPRCVKGSIVPLCPIMKYNIRTQQFGGSSEDVMGCDATNNTAPHREGDPCA